MFTSCNSIVMWSGFCPFLHLRFFTVRLLDCFQLQLSSQSNQRKIRRIRQSKKKVFAWVAENRGTIQTVLSSSLALIANRLANLFRFLFPVDGVKNFEVKKAKAEKDSGACLRSPHWPHSLDSLSRELISNWNKPETEIQQVTETDIKR